MKHRRPFARIAAGLLVAGAGMIGTVGGGSASAQTTQPTIVDITLNGVVDPWTDDYIANNVRRAEDEGADAVLLRIDTPGGLGSSMDNITATILNAQVPVIGYVSPAGARAASAGAFILLSCPVAAMAPATNVGASTPIGLDGGDLANKITQDAAASIRSLAQTYGRNADVAETFVLNATSITAQEALDENVIDYIEPTVTDLLETLDGTTVQLGDGQDVLMHTAGADLQEDPMGGFVGFLHDLLDPNLAFIFFWLGLGLIVLELIVPGHIFSGTVGTIMLALSLISFGLLPVRIIGIALLVFSVIAFVIELKAPGLGIWGLLGMISLVLGGWFLYNRSSGVSVSPAVIVPVAIVVGLFFGLVVSRVLRMRHMPAPLGVQAVVGKEGVVLGSGINRTGGVVRVASEEWRAVAPEGPLEGGRKIRVTALDGLVLTVEPIETEQHPAPTGAAQEGA
jgi:membrane-bound serine protease (ClpP class)